MRTLTLFHVADVHSHLFPRSIAIGSMDSELGLGREGQTASVGGAARLAALLDRERSRSEASLFLDSGDVLEGTSVFLFFHGVPEMLVAEALGVDAQAVGNHDLTHGAALLSALREGRTTFPLVAANLDDLVTSGLAVASAVFERGGIRVAVVGAGRPADDRVDLESTADAVQRVVDGVRSSVDLVVLLSHLGKGPDLELVPKTAGVDVILGGHTHDVLEPPRTAMDCGMSVRGALGCTPNPVIVVHSGAYGRYLGRLDLILDPGDAGRFRHESGGPTAGTAFRYTLLPVNEALSERSDVALLLSPYRKALADAGIETPIAFAPEAVSRTKPRDGDSALGNLVAHAMRVAAGADLAIINSTGVRSDLPKGTLTRDDFYEVLPFDDAVTTLDVSGRDIGRALTEVAEESCRRNRVSQAELDGATVVFDCAGNGSAEIAVAGNALESGRTYRVAVASFLTENGQWFEGRGAAIATGPPIRDVVARAVESGRPCPLVGRNAPLPCVDSASGAVVDGRISWR